MFRLREVQHFLAAVDRRREPELDGPTLRAVLADLRRRHPRERNYQLVEQTLAAHLAESGDYRQSKLALREFFGELLMEQRRERTLGEGVMLGTVHGSKGTEYDHVLLLDGDWGPRDGDTWEGRRRLYYVGMTRARRTLTLLQSGAGTVPWRTELQGPAFHCTRVHAAVETASAPALHCELLSLDDINLGFAGSDAGHADINAAIAHLATGDPLHFRSRDSRVLVEAEDGQVVGALSEKGSDRWRPLSPRIRSIRTAAVLVRRSTDEGDAYRERVRRESWSIVVPEVRYEVGPT